jgi:hypothetical protein
MMTVIPLHSSLLSRVFVRRFAMAAAIIALGLAAGAALAAVVVLAGDVAAETNGTSHGWKNSGSTKAVMISADLFPGEAPTDSHTL